MPATCGASAWQWSEHRPAAAPVESLTAFLAAAPAAAGGSLPADRMLHELAGASACPNVKVPPPQTIAPALDIC